MSALYAREWVVMITNLSYVLSSPELEHILRRYNTIMGGDLHHDSKVTFTDADYEKLLTQLLQPRTLHLGLTAMGGGLGGGSTFGVDHWMFYTHYYSLPGAPWEIITHELCHCLGYGHDSNLTYSDAGTDYGFATHCIPWLHNYLRKQGRLPYSDPGMFDFANPAYKKYWVHSVDRNLMYYNNKETKLDLYFSNNPDWNRQ